MAVELIISLFLSLIITLLALSLFDYGTYSKGLFYGWFTFGHMTLFGCLFMIYLRLFAISNTFSFAFMISFQSGVILFVVLWVIESSISGSKLYQTFLETVLNPQLYIYFNGLLGLGMVQYIFVKMEFYLFGSEVFESFSKQDSFKPVKSRSQSNSEQGSGQNMRDSLMGNSSNSDR